jgi:regulator of protease activity HflC (stomatin/prohibitin superfamily)
VDIRDAICQGKVFEVHNGADISKLFQLLQFKIDLAPILEAFRQFVDLGDHFCPIQLTQSGQQTDSSRTAFELQQRLDNAGKFVLSTVRNFARFCSDMLDAMFREWLATQPPEVQAQYATAHVRATFEANYLKRLETQKAIAFILSVTAEHPELAKRINWGKVAEIILQSASFKPEEILYPENDPALAARDAAEQAQAQAEQALVQAQLAKAQAELARAQAQANELESRIALNAAKAERESATVRTLDAGIQTDQARTANDIRRTVAEERAATAERSAPAAAAGKARPATPEPGRAAMLPGGGP